VIFEPFCGKLIETFNCMPNPKRRHSKSRTRQRRAHDALNVPQYYIDKDSGEAKVPHRIDAKTGTYKGRQIIDTKDSE
jgi:large subunit ribosomal protein L32